MSSRAKTSSLYRIMSDFKAKSCMRTQIKAIHGLASRRKSPCKEETSVIAAWVRHRSPCEVEKSNAHAPWKCYWILTQWPCWMLPLMLPHIVGCLTSFSFQLDCTVSVTMSRHDVWASPITNRRRSLRHLKGECHSWVLQHKSENAAHCNGRSRSTEDAHTALCRRLQTYMMLRDRRPLRHLHTYVMSTHGNGVFYIEMRRGIWLKGCASSVSCRLLLT